MIVDLFIYFLVYAVIGWMIETVFCSVREKRWVYRGFLYGIYCPIYGVGALIIALPLGLITVHPVLNYVLVFLSGFVFLSALEYIIGLALEKIFGMVLWDYMTYPMNLHGRIWIGYSLWWGVLSLVLVFLLHPLIVGFVSEIEPYFKNIFVGVAVVIFITDITLTILSLNAIRKKLEQLHGLTDRLKERLAYNAEEWQIRLRELMSADDPQESELLQYRKLARKLQKGRFIRTFPRFRFNKFSSQITELKQLLRKKR